MSKALAIQHPLTRQPYCERHANLLILCRVSHTSHTVGAVAIVALVSGGVFFYMKQKKASAGGGQAQGGVTLSTPAQSPDESKI